MEKKDMWNGNIRYLPWKIKISMVERKDTSSGKNRYITAGKFRYLEKKDSHPWKKKIPDTGVL